MRMFCLAPEQIALFWDDFEPLLSRFERCCGDISAAQIKEFCTDAKMQLWGLQDADEVHGVGVTEIIDTPRGLHCLIRVACGASPRPIMERLLDEIGKWAKDLGCTRVKYVGRRGWLRRFPRFEQTAVMGEWTL